MFGLFYGLLQQCLRKEEIHLLIVGLDQSGKTTLLERIKHNVTGLPSLERDQIVPTVGLNVGRVQLEHAAVVLWDLGGRPRLRSIWDKYYDETHAVMFVVDATDRERFGEVKQELEKTLAHSDLLGAPCLVVANKQDHGNAMDSAGIAEEFGIGKVDSRACIVMGMSAIDGTGVDEGLHWLLHHVRRAQRTALLRQAAGKRGGR